MILFSTFTDATLRQYNYLDFSWIKYIFTTIPVNGIESTKTSILIAVHFWARQNWIKPNSAYTNE